MKTGGEAIWVRLLETGGLGLSQQERGWVRHESEASERPIRRVLLDAELVDEPTLMHAVSRHLHISCSGLGPGSIAREAVDEVPASIVDRYHVMPVALRGERLQMAMEDPLDDELIDELSILLGRCIEPTIAEAHRISSAIRQHYGVGADTVEQLTVDSVETEDFQKLERLDHDIAGTNDAEQASVVKLVHQVLRDAIEERATDIHIEPYDDEMRIRYRIDGVLHEPSVPPSAYRLQNALVSLIKIMAQLDVSEKRLPQDGRIQLRHGDTSYDCRVSILPVPQGEAINIRVLPQNPLFHDLRALGLNDRDREQLLDALHNPYGIILLTGPTGSGKTTTLYACLSHLNTPEVKILTIEDPIEYRIRGIQQMQVAPGIGFTFDTALRSMLRHDPDVMLIGEIRDAETASVTIRTALTGHLVLSTLHTNDAASGAVRLREMGVEPYLLSGSLLAIVAQRLVRRICSECIQYSPEEHDRAQRLGLDALASGAEPLCRGRGCESCRFTGMRGRTALYEFLPIDDAVRDRVQRGEPAHAIESYARGQGVPSLREAGWEKVQAGETTIEEVLRVT